MKVVLERCAGLDVHKKSVVVCAMTPGGSETRTFSTTTKGIRELVYWLDSIEINHVAMEITGIYWKPVWNILEEVGMHQMLVNAHHFKQVPGRKTDVKDAEWIATLARHGLLKGSFVPSKDQRELRELLRYRRTLIRTRSSEIQRLQKILEEANIKLELIQRIDDVAGFAIRAAQDVLTEIGTSMDPFPTHRHLTSWAKVCPGSNESAGKNKSGRTGRGNPWLRGILNEAAQAARLKKGSYFAEMYRRIASRRGSRRAIMALSRTLLEILWCLIKRGTKYADLGPDYLDRLHTEAAVARALKRLKKLGYDAMLSKIA